MTESSISSFKMENPGAKNERRGYPIDEKHNLSNK